MATTSNYVKFLRGTPEAYKNLVKKDSDTLYFIAETDAITGELYLGEKLIAGSSNGSLNELEGIIIENIKNNSLLVYDETQNAWVNKTIVEAISFMKGASSEAMGASGLVPAPAAGEQNYFLRGDGTWAPISVDSVSSTKVFETIVQEGESDILAINRIVGTASLTNGDVAIVKNLIADDKYQHTAYIYDGVKWMAMDGNYNAENVYFDDDILVTTKVGTIQTLVNGQATLGAKGKNVMQVLSSLLAERKNPIATLPSATIDLTNDVLSYEVGTKIIPAWKTTFSAGSYTYGPDTGVTDVGGSVVSTKDSIAYAIEAGSINNATGYFSEYQVEDGTAYKATLTYGWSNGTTTPVDNFGDACIDAENNLPILAAANKTVTSNNSITGFRKWFKGGLSTDKTVELTSSIVRDNLTHSTSAVTSHTFDLSAIDYEGCKRIVIAIPANSGKKISQVLLKSASNADITSEFKEQANLEIEGAEGFTTAAYKIWIYEPASLDSTEIYTITIS